MLPRARTAKIVLIDAIAGNERPARGGHREVFGH